MHYTTHRMIEKMSFADRTITVHYFSSPYLETVVRLIVLTFNPPLCKPI